MPIYKTDEKANGVFKYRVRINYTDSAGNAKQLTRVALGAAEAKELEAALLKQIKEAPATPKMTLRQLYYEYIEVKKHETRESTVDKSRRSIELHILPSMGELRLDKLAPNVLQRWKTEIEGRNLKLKTKQNLYSEFRALLNYGVKMDYLIKNPILKVGNFKDSYAIKSKMDFYTADEYKLFIAQAKKSAIEREQFDYYVFFSIAFYTGMRKGEINALRWTDIQGNLLNVSRSITQKLKGEDRETPPKNKSSVRSLQIPAPLLDILAEHKERCKACADFSESWHICGGPRCLRDTSIENKNAQYAAAAGIKKIRVHDFRHSHASLLINSDINILEISRRLGHAKIEETLNTYAHLYPKEEEKAVAVLNNIVE